MNTEFQEGEGEFQFPNQDAYTGHYRAHMSGLAWRQGHGVYITKDGQTYKGNWIADKLNEEEDVKITFQNNDQFIGRLKKYKYNGSGIYLFENNEVLFTTFLNNKPVENIIFLDRHNHFWYGEAEANCVILTKEHAFSYELDSERGKGRPKQQKMEQNIKLLENIKLAPTYSMKEWEKIIFCKSFKTKNYTDFNECEWFREYEKYLQFYKRVSHKLSQLNPSILTSEENEWYENYSKSANILKQYKNKTLAECRSDQLEEYLRKKLLNTCAAHLVFYPKLCGE